MNTSKLSAKLRRYPAFLYRGVLAVVHHAFAAVGLIVIGFFVYQWQASHGRNAPAENAVEDVGFPMEQVANLTQYPGQHALAAYLAKRYRVANEAAQQLVSIAFGAGNKLGIDPLLILAVMAVESRLNPIAESVVGAKGLMQIIPKHHLDKLQDHGGAQALLNPETNVQIGAQILKEYIRRSGSLEAGLQWYNGAPQDESSQYAEKVIAEQQRLRQATARLERQGPKQAAI